MRSVLLQLDTMQAAHHVCVFVFVTVLWKGSSL